MTKTFEIKLDIEKQLYSPMQILFNVSGNDVGSVELQFEIIQDDAPFDLTGKTLQIGIKKPSGAVIYETISPTLAIEGKGTALLSQSAYIESGIHTAEVYITDVDDTIVVPTFWFNSWESIQAQETVPEPTGDVYWQNILNKPLTFPPSAHAHAIADVSGLQLALDSKADIGETGGGVPADHTHEIADVTGLQGALDGKADDIHTHAIADVSGLALALDGKADDVHNHTIAQVTGLQDALNGKVDDAEMNQKANLAHQHSIEDVTGLQLALDGKADDGDLDAKADLTDVYLKTETYNKTEVYNKTEINQMTMGEGGGSPVIVEDNLTSTSTTNALSSNQGRILNETKSNINHNHDTEYQPIGVVPAHSHDEYQPIGTVPAHTHDEYLTPLEADALYQPINVVPTHDHPEYLTTIPAEYLTQTEGDGRYQAINTVPTHSHTKSQITDFAHTHTEADITFGVKNAKTYVDDADNYILNTRMAGLTLWKGTQAEYDLLTPSATTLYFIVG